MKTVTSITKHCAHNVTVKYWCTCMNAIANIQRWNDDDHDDVDEGEGGRGVHQHEEFNSSKPSVNNFGIQNIKT